MGLALGVGVGLPFGSGKLNSYQRLFNEWAISVIADGGTIDITRSQWVQMVNFGNLSPCECKARKIINAWEDDNAIVQISRQELVNILS